MSGIEIKIQVALTTTSHLLGTASGKNIQAYKDIDVPVVVAQAGIHIISKKQKERAEMVIAQSAIKMAKEVKIDIEKRRILIGEPPFGGPESILVDYTHEKDSECINKFFERWTKKRMLFFEYQVRNFFNQNVCCVRGMWDIDKWYRMEIDHKPKFGIIWQNG